MISMKGDEFSMEPMAGKHLLIDPLFMKLDKVGFEGKTVPHMPCGSADGHKAGSNHNLLLHVAHIIVVLASSITCSMRAS